MLAQQHIAALDFDKAARLFKKLEKTYPQDINIKHHLYNISKANPTSEDFHSYARSILSLTNTDTDTVILQKEVFSEYVANAKPGPHLNASRMTNLAIRFTKHGFVDQAEMIVQVLLKKKIESNELVDLLVLLIKTDKSNNRKRSRQYLSELSLRAPEKVQQFAN